MSTPKKPKRKVRYGVFHADGRSFLMPDDYNSVKEARQAIKRWNSPHYFQIQYAIHRVRESR